MSSRTSYPWLPAPSTSRGLGWFPGYSPLHASALMPACTWGKRISLSISTTGNGYGGAFTQPRTPTCLEVVTPSSQPSLRGPTSSFVISAERVAGPSPCRAGLADRCPKRLRLASASTACSCPLWLSPSGKPLAQGFLPTPPAYGRDPTHDDVAHHEVVARAHPGQDGRDEQPEQFEHVLSIADRQPVRCSAVPHPLSSPA